MASDPKTIAVFLDESREAATRLEYSLEIAGTFGAHVIAVFVELQPKASGGDHPSFGFARGNAGIDDAVAAYFAGQERAIALLRERLDTATRGTGIRSEWRRISGNASLREATLHATYSDLLVLPPYRGTPDALPWSSPALVVASGVPAILYARTRNTESHAQRVVLAWNASRVARRAAADALPFLTRATHVTVVIVDPPTGEAAHGQEPGADIARLLSRHGLVIDVERIGGHHIEVGVELLRCAERLGADLLVAGAYGHSRFVEMVLGSTTQAILRNAALPVLISH